MNCIVGTNSIVFEYEGKVVRLAMDKELNKSDLKELISSFKDGFIGEYSFADSDAKQQVLLNVEGEPVIFTKMPV